MHGCEHLLLKEILNLGTRFGSMKRKETSHLHPKFCLVVSEPFGLSGVKASTTATTPTRLFFLCLGFTVAHLLPECRAGALEPPGPCWTLPSLPQLCWAWTPWLSFVPQPVPLVFLCFVNSVMILWSAQIRPVFPKDHGALRLTSGAFFL